MFKKYSFAADVIGVIGMDLSAWKGTPVLVYLHERGSIHLRMGHHRL
jgi:hypothetical protein